MIKKNSDLRILILTHYRSEAELARIMNWPRQRLNKITNGVKLPNVQEVNEIAKALKVSTDVITRFFLNQKSPIGQR